MRVLLGLAAIAATSLGSAAAGQTASFGAVNANPWVASLPHSAHHRVDGRFDDHRHGDRRMQTRIHYGLSPGYAGFGYAGYEDYSDFDGNRSFDPNKWNDWWHDRPDRAYPRWMSRNQDCARRWYSGDVLTC